MNRAEPTPPDAAPSSRETALLDRIVSAVADRIAHQRLPASTYRLQFNAELTFRQARDLVPYLAQLGVSDVYSAPLLRARSGSTHGYDVVSHGELNPEIGTREEFDALAADLQAAGLGLILDIVPNHMAACPLENQWWWDVLENGPSSPFATYFDIDWTPVKPELMNKLLLPVLGDQFGKELEDGRLTLHQAEGAFWLQYYQQRFPLAPRSYVPLLQLHLEDLEAQYGAEDPAVVELLSILTALSNLPYFTEVEANRVQERRREKEVSKRRLRALVETSPAIAAHIERNLAEFNGRRGEPRSFDRLEELLDQQAYRLADWRVAADEINYRRFFDINELAAISMEQPAVFEAAHRLVWELIERGQVVGLRIDHPDGLFDPPGYLRQLQERRFLQLARGAAPTEAGWSELEPQLSQLWRQAGCLPGAALAQPLYVVVEKILESSEPLPADWLAHGTVGYEFLNHLNGLLVNPAGARLCSLTYARLTGDTLEFDELSYRCKRLIVRMSMASELTVLANRLDRISERNRWTRDFTLNSLRVALQEVVACFEVYRTYVRQDCVLERDRKYIDEAIGRARRRNPALNASIFRFLRDVLLLQMRENADEPERAAVQQFVGRFQQLTGPIMAKALEDTAYYRYARLVSLNEVGGRPQAFGSSRESFHALNAARLPRLSRGMSTTSTHDTKRSEDVRARIAVLSEAARDWRAVVTRWVRINARLKTEVDGQPAPSRTDEFLLYQTLIGVWPGGSPTDDEIAALTTRVQRYMLKVAREAKVHTSWTSPHAPYEQALTDFVGRLLQHRGQRSFVAALGAFAARVGEHGMWNALSQVLLKIAAPGVADFYQGTELWTLTLVDPDNRQPVDFARRRTALAHLLADWRAAAALPPDGDPIDAWLDRLPQGATPPPALVALLEEIVATRQDGRIKLLTTLLGLRLRRRLSALCADGSYRPTATTGRFAEHLVTFTRGAGAAQLLVVAPRWTVDVCGFGGPPPLGERWADTGVGVPEGDAWINVFTGRRHCAGSQGLAAAELLEHWPVGLFLNAAAAAEAAGVRGRAQGA